MTDRSQQAIVPPPAWCMAASIARRTARPPRRCSSPPATSTTAPSRPRPPSPARWSTTSIPASPTRRSAMLEERLALIEGAEACRTTATGMAAVHAALLAHLKAGDRVVAVARAVRLLPLDRLDPAAALRHRQPSSSTAATSASGARRCRSPTQLVLLETPSNPMLEIVDLRAVAELAHEAGAIVVVDNVFATPLLQQPLQLGADVVVYSCTKHIDGQGRVLGGAVLGSAEVDQRHAAAVHPQHRPGAVGVQRLGAAEGPGNAAAARRGRLSQPPSRSPISWPRSRASRASGIRRAPIIRSTRWRCAQMSGGGTVVTFEVAGGKDAAFAVMNAFRLIAVSNNLGDSEVARHASGHHHAHAHRRRGTRAARHHRRRDPAVGRAGGCGRPARRPGPGAGRAAASAARAAE